MNPLRPIEIVGGGLAGLSLGLALRRHGAPVTLFEAGEYPRHRVCGEFITGLDEQTLAALELAPLLADAVPQREIAWQIGDRALRRDTLPCPALGLSRHALDARLAAAFVAAGGDLRTRARVTDVDPRPGRVLAIGRRRGRSPWLGLKAHVRNLRLDADLELHLGDGAYVGLSHVENETINVCGLFRRRHPPAAAPGRPIGSATWNLLLAHLQAAGLVSLAGQLGKANVDLASCCSVAALQFDARFKSDGAVRLGDAAAMIPPFTGNGMTMALQSAATSLGPLLRYVQGEHTWEEACDATNRALSGRFRLRLASANALHPFLLQPARQRWLAALGRTRLLPFRPLYAALH